MLRPPPICPTIMEQLNRITQRSEVMGGKACARGMRVTDDVIYRRWIDARAPDERVENLAAEISRVPVFEAAVATSACRARDCDDIGLVHVLLRIRFHGTRIIVGGEGLFQEPIHRLRSFNLRHVPRPRQY